MLHVRIAIGAFAVLAACSASNDPGAGSGGSSGNSGSSGSAAGGNGGSIVVDSGGGESGSGGTLSPDAACVGEEIAGERIPGNILFVVDSSGSMNCNAPPLQSSADCERTPVPVDAAQPSKWKIVSDALKAAIAALPPASSAGIAYFPNDGECGVSVQPAVPVAFLNPAHVAELHTSLDGVTPGGNTPIVGGVTLGYNYLNTSSLNGNKFVVLLTDGQETCAADQVAHFESATVPTALAVGIRTFVIGAPGSEPARALLSSVAHKGGTAQRANCEQSPPGQEDCHFDMTASGADFAQKLAEALDAIAGSTVSCEIDVPAPPEGGTLDPNRVNVTLVPGDGSADEPLARNDSCLADVGWKYNADKTKIILCGADCASYRGQRNAAVKIELGCIVRIYVP